MLSKLLGYNFKVEWIPGKKQTIADALSRAPVFAPEEEEKIDVIIRTLKCQEGDDHDLAIEELARVAAEDSLYQEVLTAIQNKKEVENLPPSHPGKLFKNQWDYLSVEEKYGLIVFHDRIVVPKAAQKKILEVLHLQHTGIHKTYENAKQLYFWLNMKNEIKTLVSSCEECFRLLPSQSLEPKIATLATRPFEAISLG